MIDNHNGDNFRPWPCKIEERLKAARTYGDRCLLPGCKKMITLGCHLVDAIGIAPERETRLLYFSADYQRLFYEGMCKDVY
jgi:hypothetical protein